MASTDLFELVASVDPHTVAADVPADVKCQVKLRGRPGLGAASAGGATTASICVALDCSISMLGPKLEAAIEAAKLIVDSLHERHHISLVCFHSGSELLVENVQATAEQKNGIKWTIDNIRNVAGGSTNLGRGIKEATRALAASAADAKVMIIVSDGDADSAEDAYKAAVLATRAGIQLFAVGIGAQYAADELLALVTPSNGAVFGQSDTAGIGQIFARLVGRIDSFIATNAALRITFAAGVQVAAVYKTSPERAYLGRATLDAQRTVELKVGNIERAEAYAFLLLATTPAQRRGELEVGRAVLSYDAPSLGVHEHHQEVALVLTVSAERSADTNTEVAAAFRGARQAELVQQLAEAHRRGDRAQMGAALEELAGRGFGDEAKRARAAQMLARLQKDGGLTRDMLNELVVGSTAKGDDEAGELYDVVLTSAGSGLIRIIREVRAITGLSLKKVSELVGTGGATIRQALPLADATALQEKLTGFGGQAEVRRRQRD